MTHCPALYPVFLNLNGRRVLVVGGGPVAASKVDALLRAGARITVVAPIVVAEIASRPLQVERRAFEESDLDGAWFVVAAATPAVNALVASAAEVRGVFVNAVDDPASASAYLGGVVRKGGVTFAISTDGHAPALAGLLREGLAAVLPDNLDDWRDTAERIRPQWLREQVPMPQRRPALLRALNALYLGPRVRQGRSHAMNRRGPEAPRGLVSLVGAGPGDPGLLTRTAVHRLRRADLVLYDALVPLALLQLAPRAQRFSVGKRAGRASVGQETINRLLIRAARRGQRVVRLKAGDPFVLGRGGEEALALGAAGVPFEIVPGVTSAIAAPAFAGIPVTHRGLASAFVVLSAHTEAAYAPLVDALPPHLLTLVALMGVEQAPALASRLIARGWQASTPSALIFGAFTAAGSVWRGTLNDLAHGRHDQRRDLPGTIVIGEVVTVGDALREVADTALRSASGGS